MWDRGVDTRKTQTIATVEEYIVLGYLHPRESLVEDDLLTRFALTCHAVRQGLHAPEQMGQVEYKKNIGARVE